MPLYEYMKGLQASAHKEFELQARNNTERAEVSIQIPNHQCDTFDISDLNSGDFQELTIANSPLTTIRIGGDEELRIQLGRNVRLKMANIMKDPYCDTISAGYANAMRDGIIPISFGGFPQGLLWQKGNKFNPNQSDYCGDFIECPDEESRIIRFRERSKGRIIRTFKLLKDRQYYKQYE